MPTNKKEYIIYNCFMITFMVLLMSGYNLILSLGFKLEVIKLVWLGFPLGFVIAFFCEAVLVGRGAMFLAGRVLRDEHSLLKKRAVISFFIVLGMAGFMSVYGAIMGAGVYNLSLSLWFKMYCMNFIVAYPLAFLGGFLVTWVFRNAFPVGTIVVNS